MSETFTTMHHVLMDIADYFRECKSNSAIGSAAEKRFDVYVSAITDADRMLKEQAPRVLSNNEIIKTTEVTTCYLEVKGERNLYGAYLQKYDDDHTLISTDAKNVPEMIATRHARCWSSRPTDEQREATPWNT